MRLNQLLSVLFIINWIIAYKTIKTSVASKHVFTAFSGEKSQKFRSQTFYLLQQYSFRVLVTPPKQTSHRQMRLKSNFQIFQKEAHCLPFFPSVSFRKPAVHSFCRLKTFWFAVLAGHITLIFLHMFHQLDFDCVLHPPYGPFPDACDIKESLIHSIIGQVKI